MTNRSHLKSRILKGSIYLTLRHSLGIGLSIISIVIIFKYLGPKNFGYLSIAMGLWGYIGNISSLGIDIFLIRKKEGISEDILKQAFTFILTVSVGVALLMVLGAPLLGWWLKNNEIINLFRFMAINYFVGQVSLIPRSLLERAIKYKEVSLVELFSQLSYYLIAIPLVLLGWSYWGVAVGGLISSVIVMTSYLKMQPVKLTKKIDVSFLKESLKYGVSYQAAVWTWNLRDLTVPLLVSKLGGVEVAGIINATVQIVNRLSFVKMVFWRISISALARVQDDIKSLMKGINKGMYYNIVVIGTIFLLFFIVSPWLVNMMGDRWFMVNKVFPFIVLGVMVNSIFSLHCSALFAKGLNKVVNKFHLAHIIILWIFTIVLTPFVGVWGFCFAEVGAISSYIVLHKEISKYLVKPDYSRPILLLSIITIIIFAMAWLPKGIGVIFFIIFGSSASILIPAVRGIYRDFFNEIITTLRGEGIKDVASERP